MIVRKQSLSTRTESSELINSMLEKMNQMQTNSTWRHEPASSHSNSKVTSRQEPPELSLVFRELMPLASDWQNGDTLLNIPCEDLQMVRLDNLN